MGFVGGARQGVGGDEGGGEGGGGGRGEEEDDIGVPGMELDTGGVRRRAKKKDKSAARKRELEARRDRAQQRMLAGQDELFLD